MTTEEKVAFINSQIACANIEAMGMVAENMQRASLGHSMAYDDSAFAALIDQYGISHNAVLVYFQP